MENTKLYVQVEDGSLRPVNVPEKVIQALLFVPQTSREPYRNIPVCAKNRVLECLVESDSPMTYKQIMDETGYSQTYLYSVVGVLIYEKKVIGQRYGTRDYRYRVSTRVRNATIKRMEREAMLPDLGILLDGFDDTIGVRVSQRAARSVLRYLTRAKKPVAEEKLIATNIYSKWYLLATIKVLMKGGLVKAIIHKGVCYYKPTKKVARIKHVL